jgi:hypothetical protein
MAAYRIDAFAVDFARGITPRGLADDDLEVAQDYQQERRLEAGLNLGPLCQMAFVHRAANEFLLQDSEPHRERRRERTKALGPGWLSLPLSPSRYPEDRRRPFV